MVKTVGIVSYNINCNFTNYGSALQSWALSSWIERLGCNPVLVDYCPIAHLDSNPLNPFKNMWDKDEESRHVCELTMPAIRENFAKFEQFYSERFNLTPRKYTAETFDEIVQDCHLDGFVCGSDTIFCIDEFKGFEEAYYANCGCMRGRSVAYAASFGDSHFKSEDYALLNERLKNFKAIALRENQWVPYCKEHAKAPVEKVLDPTLLLKLEDYERIAARGNPMSQPYLLLYARRYNEEMERYAIRLAKERGLKIVEISLRATNTERGHVMRYDAGVEEFLSLVRHAECVITNSFHGLIFAVHYSRPFVVFSREQADSKIVEVLNLFGAGDKLFESAEDAHVTEINYGDVNRRLDCERQKSLDFLKMELGML